MIGQKSEATGREFPIQMLSEVNGVARSSMYAAAETKSAKSLTKKRGPKTEISDEQMLKRIREVLKERSFHGEGHRKVHAVLRNRKDVKVGRNRILRLMRENGLLAPVRFKNKRGDKAHAGTIITNGPNAMWGTDGARFETEENGWCWFFGAIDHGPGDIVGWNVAKIGNRFEALEPIRQGVRREFGGIAKDVARGLTVRCDYGSQYISDAFQGELKYQGISISHSYVREPQCNGVIERFMRTLKEQVIYCHRFKNLQEARRIIGEFIQRYNREWLQERHGYLTPMEVRQSYAA